MTPPCRYIDTDRQRDRHDDVPELLLLAWSELCSSEKVAIPHTGRPMVKYACVLAGSTRDATREREREREIHVSSKRPSMNWLPYGIVHFFNAGRAEDSTQGVGLLRAVFGQTRQSRAKNGQHMERDEVLRLVPERSSKFPASGPPYRSG